MPPHSLTNFEIQIYSQDEPKFNGVYGAYIVNLDEYKSKGTQWRALYVNANNIVCFDSFGVEHIPKEIKKFIGNKNIIINIYRIQAFSSIMCGYFVLDLLILCLKVKPCLFTQMCFLLMIMKRAIK